MHVSMSLVAIFTACFSEKMVDLQLWGPNIIWKGLEAPLPKPGAAIVNNYRFMIGN